MKRTAFTLIEILIVVILLGILAAIVVPQFADVSDEAAESAAQTDISTLNSQLQLWTNLNPNVARGADYAAMIALMTAANADGSAAVLTQAPTPPSGYTYSFDGTTFDYTAP
ncbi:MAG: prepilin-type N-terminal cleavage/methylation domain-containing protein [Planctomycetes bacterium]|jgi:general secretion pathway protein G|nr:prepilin-type N-terminal cleavage/methylation domain-containing protein [Planctomycetota bacterium]